MSSRRFTTLVNFQRPQRTTADSGQVLETFDDDFHRWCDVRPLAIDEKTNNDQKIQARRYTCKLLYDAAFQDVTGQWRMIFDASPGKPLTLNIRSAEVITEGRYRMVQIVAEVNR
jgi:head-tail adaptor